MAKPVIGRPEIKAVTAVLKSGMLAQGPVVKSFEEAFSELVDGRPTVAVNSGTSALHLMILALGIGPGDEVIVPSFTFAATANAVALAGATPVFADIELETFNLDPADVERKISSKTRAILPVHLYGHPANMRKFDEITRRHKLLLLEDAAQAHLATDAGVPVGAWGDAAAFSFYPTKNMTAGEGGMVTLANEAIARKIRVLRNQGMEVKYQNEVVGFNNRMTDIHAAIGVEQLKRLKHPTKRRIDNADYLTRNLKSVVTPAVRSGAVHVYHQYTIRVPADKRAALMAWLAEKSIGSDIYYPTPVHRLPSFNFDLNLPNTEIAASECLSLPVHPGLSKSDLKRIVSAVDGFRG
jgi:dTDP-4-amino-4,6-dideoxygalactose transaminase